MNTGDIVGPEIGDEADLEPTGAEDSPGTIEVRRRVRETLHRAANPTTAQRADDAMDQAIDTATTAAYTDGRAAAIARDFDRAEQLLLLVTARELRDATILPPDPSLLAPAAATLATLYAQRGDHAMAQHWTTIAHDHAGSLQDILDQTGPALTIVPDYQRPQENSVDT